MAELITVARPYAEAVFRLAKQEGKLEQWSEVLANLAAIARDETALAVVADPKYSAAQLQQLLVGLLGGNVGAQVENFIAVVLENRRFAALPDVAELFESLKVAEEGEVKAVIASAFPLNDAQVAQLQSLLASELKRKVEAEVQVDTDLIGGVTVTVGDLVIDASVRGKLTALATSLKS
ncbi:ATP synthase subunit delta [Chitiniphilus shinanonensis]|uniref:ATP synthase subunit delta n=1 Tax=Chitiniphilus shinanonensis TaxID=553088 RepID=A0ABQ6BT09_9NEIS|nr:F0F1 ATP synthase subunit delta [Chitiniphilus shinanonensis]GLS03033.1 ATP synthase subunit delta [Chitiniphilus shinanonensis]